MADIVRFVKVRHCDDVQQPGTFDVEDVGPAICEVMSVWRDVEEDGRWMMPQLTRFVKNCKTFQQKWADKKS